MSSAELAYFASLVLVLCIAVPFLSVHTAPNRLDGLLSARLGRGWQGWPAEIQRLVRSLPEPHLASATVLALGSFVVIYSVGRTLSSDVPAQSSSALETAWQIQATIAALVLPLLLAFTQQVRDSEFAVARTAFVLLRQSHAVTLTSISLGVTLALGLLLPTSPPFAFAWGGVFVTVLCCIAAFMRVVTVSSDGASLARATKLAFLASFKSSVNATRRLAAMDRHFRALLRAELGAEHTYLKRARTNYEVIRSPATGIAVDIELGQLAFGLSLLANAPGTAQLPATPETQPVSATPESTSIPSHPVNFVGPGARVVAGRTALLRIPSSIPAQAREAIHSAFARAFVIASED
jgi:hypothetical protein